MTRRFFLKAFTFTGLACGAMGLAALPQPVFAKGNRRSEVKTQKYQVFHSLDNTDKIKWTVEHVPFDYVMDVENDYSNVGSLSMLYDQIGFGIDDISNCIISRDGFGILVKNGAQITASSYNLTEGIIDNNAVIHPLKVTYVSQDKTVNVQFIIDMDQVEMIVDGQNIVGDQITISKNNRTAIVSNNDVVSLAYY